jgi:hypothetical protein
LVLLEEHFDRGLFKGQHAGEIVHLDCDGHWVN